MQGRFGPRVVGNAQVSETDRKPIERAKAKGTKFGRPTALDAGQRRKIAERYANGETMAELAREYECGEATNWRVLKAA
jgi:DNA invertase Pin-like site-specific DNA recombinase